MTEMNEQLVETLQSQVPVVQLSQKDAVYKYIAEAITGTNITFDMLKVKAQEKTPEVKLLLKDVRRRLYEGIKSGEIVFKKEGKTDSELRKYTSGLINHWLKRDTRFAV
jgi:hypothetical protein